MLLLGRATRASASTFPSEIGSTGSPSCRGSPEEWPGPPRFLDRPFRARHGRTPRQVCHPLALLLVMALLPSGILAPWAPGIFRFRGRIPVAHTLAGLRIAVTVTRTGARPCFRPAGLGFGRVGFSPTGRHTEFQSVSPPPSFRTSLAWSLPISRIEIVGFSVCDHRQEEQPRTLDRWPGMNNWKRKCQWYGSCGQ